MQKLSITKNDVGRYEYNTAVTLNKNINRVLKKQLFKESKDGMVGLGRETLSTLTNFKSNFAIKKSNVKRKSIAEAVAARSATNIIGPQYHNKRQHSGQDRSTEHRTAPAIRVKEATASAITLIIGVPITNAILCKIYGLDFRTVDDYALHQMLRAVKGGA